ncbi:MAG: arsenate reductase [Polaromonas sp. 28-63-22]|nr:MAG: arsenate reductase [Polaromonas sp. 28-63-22]
MTTLYGIPNCDTVKKARTWLAAHGKAYVFHDFKKQGVPPDRLAQWVEIAGWESLLNRKGSTWRKLAADEQLAVHDSASAQALMLAQPSIIRRPVVQWGDGGADAGVNGDVSVGFDPQMWEKRA